MKSKLIKLINNFYDLKFLKISIFYIFEKIETKIYLYRLKKHHTGKNYNFNKIQNKRLRRVLKHSFKNSEYYRNEMLQKNISLKKNTDIRKELSKLPLLTKDTLRSKNESVINFNKDKSFMTYITTGGSTGEPLGFYSFGGFDREHQIFLYKLYNYKSGDKILTLDGTTVNKEVVEKGVYWTRKSKKDLPYGSMALSSHYLTEENIDAYIDYIFDFKPAFIRGYPSFITKIAIEMIKNKKIVNWTLKGVQLTSESFSEEQVNIVNMAFGSKVFSQYGHSEASVFGYSIDESLLIYCSPLYGYTEILNEAGEQVSENEIGEIVVTGFNNYGQSFIRYKTGDLGSFKKEENGIKILNKVIGRTQDVVYGINGEEVRLTALIFGRHYKAMGRVKKWQLIQHKKGEIIFQIIKDKDFSSKDENEIRDNFLEIANIKTDFIYVNDIPLTARGKSKLLIQNINGDDK